MTEHVDPKTLEAIAQEVKGISDDAKKLGLSLQKDLADVRKLAEETKGTIGPEVKAQVDALLKSVEEKQAAFEKTGTDLTARMDGIEKKANRPIFGSPEQVETERKSWIEFNRSRLARQGQLKVGTDPSVEQFSMDAFKLYAKSFPFYLRRGEQIQGNVGLEAKDLAVGVDPDGGYFVTPVISARVLIIITETSPIRELATVETITTDAIEYPIDENLASAGWVGETQARPVTGTPQVGTQRIPAHEMYASPQATQKLLEDAGIDVEAWLARKIGEKFALVEATAFVAGAGVNQPRGFTTYPAGTARGQIEQVNSGAATAITFDGLISLQNALKEPYQNGATWLMRRASVGAVMLLKDGDGQYLWRPALTQGQPSTLLGYPVRWAADMPAIAASALAVAYGNFRAGYTIVDRLGITTLRDPFTAKPFVLFYTRRRVGGDVTTFEAIKLLKISA